MAVLLILALIFCYVQAGNMDKYYQRKSRIWLEGKAKEEGVMATESGLLYKVLKSGPDGPKPKETDTVKVHYKGSVGTTGVEFDSSYDRGEPVSFPLNQVVPGWVEGLQLMKPGDHFELYLPPNLGYGENGADRIPPFSALLFEVELLEFSETEELPRWANREHLDFDHYERFNEFEREDRSIDDFLTEYAPARERPASRRAAARHHAAQDAWARDADRRDEL